MSELPQETVAGDALIDSFQQAPPKQKELITGILFQFADSQLAGAAGYNACLNWGPSLDDRIELSMIIAEKLVMAKKTYAILAEQNLNMDRYFASHSFEAKVLRSADLGFRRASADKRLNALLYPLESWVDMAVFAYLMSSMTCYTLSDFLHSNFVPLKDLAESCLQLEKGHEAFGEKQLKKIAQSPANKIAIQSSLYYWYFRVATSFGPEDSARNDQYRQYHLKAATNSQLKDMWSKQVQEFFAQLKINIPTLDQIDAAACH